MSDRAPLTEDERRRLRTAYVKRLHDERRRLGVCIQNPKHGPAFRGGRCLACWNRKLAAERGESLDV